MLVPFSLILAVGAAPPPAEAAVLELAAAPAGGLTARLERGGAPQTWPRVHAWLFVRSGGGQENIEHATRTATGVTLPTPDQAGQLTVVGLDLPPRVELVLPDRWEALLAEHGHAAPPATGRAVRVRRVESAKTLLRTAAGPPSAVALAKTGQAVELRPVGDPTGLASFGDLPLRGYAPGGAGGALLRAVHAQSGDVRTATLDDSGLGHVSLGLAGRWVVTLTAVRPLAGDPAADWELATATLAFDAEGEER